MTQVGNMTRGVVILSIHDWWYHSHGHSDFQLARAFARYLPVLFVNSIGMRAPRPGQVSAPIARVMRKLKSAARRFVFPDAEYPRLAVATPISVPIYSGLLGEANSSLVEFQVRRFCSRARIQAPVILVSVPTYGPIAMRLPREALFYNRSDLHSAFQGINIEHIRRCEETLLQSADAVLYVSDYLFRAELHRVTTAVLIGHGVDKELFKPAGPTSAEFEGMPCPRAGFFGELRERSVDFALIANVARLCPSIQFVLGGAQLDSLALLTSLANVRILPACPHREMPARWRSVDVAILPYKQNAWLQASEPVKLNEIFAMGVPAVGTPMPSFDHCSDFVDVARGPEAFAEAVQKAVTKSSMMDIAGRESRCAAANLNSWDSIAQKIDRLSGDIAISRSGCLTAQAVSH